MARGRPLQRGDAGTLADFNDRPGRRCGFVCGPCCGSGDEGWCARRRLSSMDTATRCSTIPSAIHGPSVTVVEEMPVEEMHRRMQGLTAGPEGGKMPPETSEVPKVDPIPARLSHGYALSCCGRRPGAARIYQAGIRRRRDVPDRRVGGRLHAEARIGDSMLMMGGGIPGREFQVHTEHPRASHLCEGCRRRLQESRRRRGDDHSSSRPTSSMASARPA